MRIGVLVFLMLTAGCAQTPSPAALNHLEDVLVSLVECIDDGLVRRDDGVTSADAVARTIVSGCTARRWDVLDDLTSGKAVSFMKGFEEGLVDKATEQILTTRASRLT